MENFLNFCLVHKGDKTSVYSVDSKRDGSRLAVVKWYGPWRQYTLWPEPQTVWNPSCLQDVTDFIDNLMKQRALVSGRAGA